MSTETLHIGHATLTLKQIAPAVSGAFSPNLHKWMRSRGHVFRDGGVLQSVYRIKPGTRLAESFGAGTLMIGYRTDDYAGDTDFIGVRLMAVLCQGTKAGSFCYAGASQELDEVADFWDQYLKVGRCAIDPEHRRHFIGDRYGMHGDTRICLWCGTKHQRVTTPRTVFDESWKQI